MKKIPFGIFIATMAIAVSTLSTNATNKKRGFETVVFVGSNRWMLVYDHDEGVTWDCFSGGTKCKGMLKPGSTPDVNGYYDEVDVVYVPESKHFEPL